MSTPTQVDQKNEFAQIIYENIHGRLKDGQFQTSILPVLQEVLEFSQTIVTSLEDDGQSAHVCCRKGCTYCCHSQVSIIPIEALMMFTFVKNNFNRQETDALLARIERVRSLTAGKSAECVYAMKAELPCVFLDSGTCSIYEVRPSICRSWSSFDSDACRSAFLSADSSSSIAFSQARNFVFGTTRDMFQQLSKQLELQSDTLLLHNAMFDCFHSPDSLAGWIGRKGIFKYTPLVLNP